MNVLAAKLLSMTILGIVSIIFGLLPIFVKSFCLSTTTNNNNNTGKTKKSSLFISAITCLGGGVILTTSLTHMLPEVNLLLKTNIEQGHFPITGDNYNTE